MFLEKCYFIEDIEIYCSNSDEECYDEECINSFLETLKKQETFLAWDFKVLSWNIKTFFSLRLENSISRNIRHFFKADFLLFELGKLPLEIFFLKAREFNLKKYKKNIF